LEFGQVGCGQQHEPREVRILGELTSVAPSDGCQVRFPQPAWLFTSMPAAAFRDAPAPYGQRWSRLVAVGGALIGGSGGAEITIFSGRRERRLAYREHTGHARIRAGPACRPGRAASGRVGSRLAANRTAATPS